MNEEALDLEIAALKHRLALLEGERNPTVATLSTLSGEGSVNRWETQEFVNIIPEPKSTVPLHTLVGADGLPRESRELRRVLEAVALCYNLPAPNDVPRTWIAPLRDVYAAHDGGASWADALHAAGLVAPTDLTPHQQAARSELRELWDNIPAMVEWVKRNTLSSVGHKDLLLKLRQLLE